MINGREIHEIICSCGGKVEFVDTTAEEDTKYGCPRKNCCARAIECSSCHTRIVFSLLAPDPDYD